MTQYHINPESGEPGPCNAKISCRFGENQEHYDSKEDARKAYEARQEAEIRKPELEAGELRFGKETEPAEISRLGARLRNLWQVQPRKTIKVRDRYGYATGGHKLSYDENSGEFQLHHFHYRASRVVYSTRNLNELLTTVAGKLGYSDEEYELLD